MYLKLGSKEITNHDLNLIVDVLKKGGVIVYPTDTIYGLGCLASNSKAIKKIKAIKKREVSKPLLVLVSSLAMVKKYCHLSKNKESILKNIWQETRPTSVILEHRNLLSNELVNKHDGLAVRLPKSDFLLKIVRRIKEPLVSTSFNLSGEPVLNRVDNLQFNWNKNEAPDLIIDDGVLKNKASRLLDLRGDKVLILRK
ncbi:MAG: L-threonylcarbamoyladenylate synthase [Patescibacteria group bacterium]